MAGKSNSLANGILNLIFQGTAMANLFENASASPLTVLYVSLHTADPGPGGSQASNEAAYTGYARIAVNRDNTGWTTSTAEVVSPVNPIVFGVSTGGGTPVVGYMGIGEASTGPGTLLYSGPISPSITVSLGVEPELTTGTTISEA